MLGFNTEKVVADELSALSNNGEKFEWDIGDRVRSALYGLTGKDYSRETLKKAVYDLQTENINFLFLKSAIKGEKCIDHQSLQEVSTLEIKKN